MARINSWSGSHKVKLYLVKHTEPMSTWRKSKIECVLFPKSSSEHLRMNKINCYFFFCISSISALRIITDTPVDIDTSWKGRILFLKSSDHIYIQNNGEKISNYRQFPLFLSWVIKPTESRELCWEIQVLKRGTFQEQILSLFCFHRQNMFLFSQAE